ncbi:MAG: fructose-6-phosphate aldolase [Alphaproteobacteria bacterium]|nr:fructose-6-phosphate aldolase [Alphaproteobacteria bacterium]
MKFFIDSANIDDIRALADLGIVDGITSNPTLIAQTGRPFFKVMEEICALIQGPVSAEVTAIEAEQMVQEGLVLHKIAPNIVIKVPSTPQGIKACKMLHDQGIKVNVTLCFSALQALIAAKAGATFISPFIGRLDDINQDGMALIDDIVQIYGNYPEYSTEILAASIRHPYHVLLAAKAGADIITVPPKILWQLFQHPLTDKGLSQFLDDWKKTGQSIL